MEYQYFINEKLVGVLRTYGVKKGDINYYYDSLNWKGENYYLYPFIPNVNSSPCDVYYCVYRDNKLIAIMYQHGFTTNHYDIYALDNADYIMLSFVCETFNRNYDVPSEQINSHAFYHTRQDLFSNKFDSTFIDKIKSLNK